jgi:hydroxymethylpyrimidine pyrophosphatase-like HAD family hydrolase
MYLLATDLDGTFLGGRQADRLALYRILRARPDIRLAFVTGRGVETVLPLLSDPLIPDPEIIISDVGATVVRGHPGTGPAPAGGDRCPVAWRPGDPGAAGRGGGADASTGPPGAALLLLRRGGGGHPGGAGPPEGHPLDVLHSAGKYLDVLPAGVNKGSTLRGLLPILGLEDPQVMVAGDTLNDLALFTSGLRGVVVGGAEERLDP